jgi:diaminopimelate decarboxylase
MDMHLELTAQALRDGVLTESHPVVFLFDLPRFEATLDEVQAAFPAGTLHALAVKACPVGRLLRHAVARGFGLEAASAGELALALRIARPESILLDSPAKTFPELEAALAAGVHVNLDNLQEVARVASLGPPPGARIGLRVNPVVGAGRILHTSTAMAGSKFGVDLAEHGEQALAAFREHSWLTGLHVHVGSAGCDLGLLARGVAVVADLADRIEQAGRRLSLLDIGGGLPIDTGEPIAAYIDALARTAPAVLSGRWRLATELGRRVFGPPGILVARVEYTKTSGGRRIAIAHAGGDLFVRRVFAVDGDPLQIEVLGPDGRPRTGTPEPWDVGGPLCFSGDLIARGQDLPSISPGDLLVVRNAGAYTFSHSTRYNSRPLPGIYGWRPDRALEVLRPPETIEEIVRYWDR